jgi:hypothetical protein
VAEGLGFGMEALDRVLGEARAAVESMRDQVESLYPDPRLLRSGSEELTEGAVGRRRVGGHRTLGVADQPLTAA